MISISPDFLDAVLDLTCALQQIPSPTFHEGQRALFVMEHLKTLDLQDVQLDSAGNVLARVPGKKGDLKPLIVSAHMDTVHPLGTGLGLQRMKDRIVGPGIGDNALGLAALLMLPRMLQDCPPTGDVWLAANVAEEGLGDLRGMQAVVNRFGERALAYLVIEGMGLGNVLHRGLGVERYRIAVHTAGGHSWVDHGQPSAIHELCGLVNRLVAVPLPQKPATTLNVGIIHGGTSVNSIAANAWLELDLRSTDRGCLENLVQQIRTIVYQAERGDDVQVTMERIGLRQAGALHEKHPLIHLACTVLRALKLEPRLDIASTDSNLPLSRGYPSICIGITNGNNAHAADEMILTGPVAAGMAQLYEIVTRVWKETKTT